jgi:protein-tyrosine phosphatase
VINSEIDIQLKFQDLVWMERNRLAQGALSESPDHQFAIHQEPNSKHLDRYSNIMPFNNNRIRLQVPEGHNDYINASPIILKSRKTGIETRYIAMQGPKEVSTNHVWHMVWHELESPVVIAMLTETHEAGQEKCFQYYPKGVLSPPLVINERDEFGDGFKATIQCVEEESTTEGAAIEIRKFIMRAEGKEEKLIYHLIYTKWPDFGVPAGEDLDSFFKLMELSREKNSNPNNPRIIHCSAGVGRSGTFISLEHLMSELQVGALNPKDGQDAIDDDPVFSTVNTLREQRKSMVQSEIQYCFIYRVLRRLWEQNHPDTIRSSEMSYGEPTAKVAKHHESDDVFS